MRRETVSLVAVLAFITAAPAFAWAPTAEVQQGLVHGDARAEVLPDTDGAGLIHAAIDIAAPPRTVWTVMTDCRMVARMIASVTSCKVTQGDQNHGWDVREQVTRGGLFVPTIRNVVREDFQPYSLIRFHKIGGDLKIEEGEWRLQSLNGGSATRVIYVNRVAANIMAPAFVVRAGLRKDTSKVLMNLRRESLAARN